MQKNIKGNKLQLAWQGPFRVIAKMTDINYVIQEEEEEGRRVVHINMIKPYCRKNNFVFYAIKEMPNEKPEIQYCIGKEGVNPSTTLGKLKLALLYHQSNKMKQKPCCKNTSKSSLTSLV